MCHAQNEWYPGFKVNPCLSLLLFTLNTRIHTQTHARSQILKPFSGRAAECVLITVCECVVTTQSQLLLPEWDFPLFSPLTPPPLFHLSFSCISLHLFRRQKIIISQERQFPAPMVPYTLPIKSFWKPYILTFLDYFVRCVNASTFFTNSKISINQFQSLPVTVAMPYIWLTAQPRRTLL